jgi:hypothetical protein
MRYVIVTVILSARAAAPARPAADRSVAAPPRPAGGFKPGDRVRHPDHGVGQVEKVIASLAKVSFASGTKMLDLASAPPEKLG